MSSTFCNIIFDPGKNSIEYLLFGSHIQLIAGYNVCNVEISRSNQWHNEEQTAQRKYDNEYLKSEIVNLSKTSKTVNYARETMPPSALYKPQCLWERTQG